MPLDTSLYTHLAELVICCSTEGVIRYANPAAQHWAGDQPEEFSFSALFAEASTAKSRLFLEAVCAASVTEPTPPWELTLGSAHAYTTGHFRGYNSGDELIIFGQIEPEQIGEMHREMLALTSELAEAQREQRRQNRELQQSLAEQRRLLETIRDLTAPAIPIWQQVLLLPIVGYLDSHRARILTEDLLRQANERHARYAILDVSGIAAVDTAVAKQLISAAEALRLLGVQPILTGINPEIAQTIVHLGVELPGFIVHSDLQHAVAYVLNKVTGNKKNS